MRRFGWAKALVSTWTSSRCTKSEKTTTSITPVVRRTRRVDPEVPADILVANTSTTEQHTKEKKQNPTMRVSRRVGTVMEWTDIRGAPSADVKVFRTMVRKELLTHNVHTTFIKDINKPLQLPQCSIAGEVIMLTLRVAETKTISPGSSQSIPDLSNRFTLILFPSKVITVHRIPISAVTMIKSLWEEKYKTMTRDHFVNSLVRRVIATFEHTVYECSLTFDGYEASLLGMSNAQRSSLSYDIYDVKRRVSIYNRLLDSTNSSFLKYSRFAKIPNEDAFRQDIIQYITHVASLSEELNESARELLHLNFQMSAHHLNDLMRVLTLISVFFLPMNFVAAFYGMNFEVLPGIKDEWGWLVSVAVMVTSSVIFFMMFRRAGYMG